MTKRFLFISFLLVPVFVPAQSKSETYPIDSASRLGIQVLDQTGRVNAILPVPSGQPGNSSFGGPDFSILYVTCGDQVYRRKLKARGANAFDPAYKLKIAKLY